MEAFIDAVQEFYKSFLEKINAVLTNEDKDLNVSIPTGFRLIPAWRDGPFK